MPAATDPSPAEAAVRWFVRARAPDFGAADQQELADWLAADPRNRSEWSRLEGTWKALDGVTRQVGPRRPFPSSPPPSRQRRRWLALGGLAVAGLAAAFVLPDSPTLYRTAPGEHISFVPAAGVTVSLNADSSVEIVAWHPLRLDLKRGDMHLDIAPGAEPGLEVAVADFRIRDIGTRFAVGSSGDGGWVAVARGLVEIRGAGAPLSVAAGRRVDFAAGAIFAESPVAESDVAPWRKGRWHFDATPLAEIAGELARQRDIRLEFDDPGIAELTVSGRFDIADPQGMLWAVSQVHGLRLAHPGQSCYLLARQ